MIALPPRILVSFDIDGTLEMGDPPGPLTAAFVRHAKAQGCVIGSASDRTLREQSAMWQGAGIEVDFISAKQNLGRVRDTFACRRFVHFGDTLIDAHFAELAGFEFLSVLSLPARAAHEIGSPDGISEQFARYLGALVLP